MSSSCSAHSLLPTVYSLLAASSIHFQFTASILGSVSVPSAHHHAIATKQCCCRRAMLLLQIWNCSQDQSNHIVHEFFKSDHFNDGIPIIPGGFATPLPPSIYSRAMHQAAQQAMLLSVRRNKTDSAAVTLTTLQVGQYVGCGTLLCASRSEPLR